ncbi:MAG: adenylate kinase family protein [Candidatus Dependentiae bacterium]
MIIILLLLSFCFSLYGFENYILIGPPGSGKGTFSSKMTQEFNYKQICPGDILRTHIKNETELGKSIKTIVESGDYIDDQIIFKIIDDQVRECIHNNIPFIIDGFPRNIDGFNFLNNLFEQLKIKETIVYVHFIINDKICIDRISNRLVCFNCYSIYNLKTKIPLNHMVCDNCNHQLEQRLGDNKKNTIKRLSYYRTKIEPLIDLARMQFKIIEKY